MALGGFIMCGILFCPVSFIVKKAGTGWLDVMFPPAAMGAIVAVIGLELAACRCGYGGIAACGRTSARLKTIIISMVTLAVTVFGSVLFRGFMAIIPILIGVLAGLRALLRDGRRGHHADSAGPLVCSADVLHAAL